MQVTRLDILTNQQANFYDIELKYFKNETERKQQMTHP